MSKGSNRVEAVERALSVLDAFKQGTATLTLAEIASRTGLYKSTILRLIGSLEHCGYISRTSSGKYCLGLSIFQLGLLYKRSFDVEDILRPVLQRLVAATNETAAYYVQVGEQRLCLYRENSPRSARHHLDEGSLLPLDVGATGRLLLAYGRHAADESGPYLEIRKLASCMSLGERDPDVAAVAVPVLDQDGAIYGALSVSGLMSRYDALRRDQALACLSREAQALSEVLQKHFAAI